MLIQLTTVLYLVLADSEPGVVPGTWYSIKLCLLAAAFINLE